MPIISQLNARATKKHPKSPNLLFMTIQFSKYVEGLSCDRHCDKHWKYKYSKTHAHVFKKITFSIFRNVSEFELTFKKHPSDDGSLERGNQPAASCVSSSSIQKFGSQVTLISNNLVKYSLSPPHLPPIIG